MKPKTMKDLRAWVNERDERGHLMQDDWIVMVTDSGVQAHHPEMTMAAAMFSTAPEEDECMSSHTPGPWAVRWPEDDELHEIYAENGGDLICYPAWTANQKANVPLIAAAPELLAALKRLVEEVEESMESDSDWKGYETRAMKQASEAIAKAEGRAK